MRKIAVIGIGYVGLVTGVCLAEIGHKVTCIDIDEEKIKQVKGGKAPFYEPGLEELIVSNLDKDTLRFTTDYKWGLMEAEIIYIAVGTPINRDGSADLKYIEQASKQIALQIKKNVIIVIKSTVPIGTNEFVNEMIQANLIEKDHSISIVSNPEFLREGSAIQDTFFADRIIIGANDNTAASIIEEVNKPFGIPIVKTNTRSAELIKYAANSFLATKISFINEIANLCEEAGANIEDVAFGMGFDDRIGAKYLNAGIGYGGSCLPKDTNAFIQIANGLGSNFDLLQAVIKINEFQILRLLEKVNKRFENLQGKKIALLGLAFKPNTDDMREAPSIVISNKLIEQGANVYGYDPVAVENAKKVLPPQVCYTSSIEEALIDADFAIIATEWQEIKELPLKMFEENMKIPLIFDGRNCYTLDEMKKYRIEYHSVGRPKVNGL